MSRMGTENAVVVGGTARMDSASHRISLPLQLIWRVFRTVVRLQIKVKSIIFTALCLSMGMRIGRGIQFKGWPTIRATNYRRITIKDHAIIEKDVVIWQGDEADIIIGEHAYIGRGTTLNAATAYGGLFIGKDVLIGAYSLIQDNDHGIEPGVTIRHQGFLAEPIVIEDDVWLGAQVIVLKGVTIKTGAVIGANSTVTKSVEGNAIAVGSPAKVRRLR